MNVTEGIESRFEVVCTGVVIIGQEEGHAWSEIGLCAHGKPVEAPK